MKLQFYLKNLAVWPGQKRWKLNARRAEDALPIVGCKERQENRDGVTKNQF